MFQREYDYKSRRYKYMCISGGMICKEMDSCLAKWATGFKLFNFRSSVQDFKSDFCSQKGDKRANLETQRRTKAETSFQWRRPRGKGFILISPVNLWGLTLTWGRSWPSAILLDTLYNFCNFNILGKKFFFFLLWSTHSVDVWVVWPDLNFEGHD